MGGGEGDGDGDGDGEGEGLGDGFGEGLGEGEGEGDGEGEGEGDGLGDGEGDGEGGGGSGLHLPVSEALSQPVAPHFMVAEPPFSQVAVQMPLMGVALVHEVGQAPSVRRLAGGAPGHIVIVHAPETLLDQDAPLGEPASARQVTNGVPL